MDDLKQMLEDAAVELGDAKKAYSLAKQKFDSLYEKIAHVSSKQQHSSFPPVSKKDLLLKLMQEQPDKHWSAKELIDQIGINSNTLRSLLSQLKLKGQVFSEHRGLWKMKIDDEQS
ncbi:MAG TPA: hypothetical protein PLJ37_01040 [Chitinophagales bacterium]|nr:hypothetical protein [Chitinophagales bacterium]HMW93411.1 hypothetical protein [Chitinophagales bacterium]HMZ92966.1 hypothetical protein [Chitinophagales bacterium]HNG25970.1 hypothetical protein [Chitinophagales bacterium]